MEGDGSIIYGSDHQKEMLLAFTMATEAYQGLQNAHRGIGDKAQMRIRAFSTQQSGAMAKMWK